MPSCLQVVTEQFPLLQERVVCLFDRDPVFQELCQDYEICTQALARQPASQGLRREYAALRLRLETELLGYLQEDVSRVRRE